MYAAYYNKKELRQVKTRLCRSSFRSRNARAKADMEVYEVSENIVLAISTIFYVRRCCYVFTQSATMIVTVIYRAAAGAGHYRP